MSKLSEISSHLVKHLKDNLNVKCPFCEKLIESVSNFYMHIKRSHNNQCEKVSANVTIPHHIPIQEPEPEPMDTDETIHEVLFDELNHLLLLLLYVY
jgi:hypothetical protein